MSYSEGRPVNRLKRGIGTTLLVLGAILLVLTLRVVIRGVISGELLYDFVYEFEFFVDYFVGLAGCLFTSILFLVVGRKLRK